MDFCELLTGLLEDAGLEEEAAGFDDEDAGLDEDVAGLFDEGALFVVEELLTEDVLLPVLFDELVLFEELVTFAELVLFAELDVFFALEDSELVPSTPLPSLLLSDWLSSERVSIELPSAIYSFCRQPEKTSANKRTAKRSAINIFDLIAQYLLQNK